MRFIIYSLIITITIALDISFDIKNIICESSDNVNHKFACNKWINSMYHNNEYHIICKKVKNVESDEIKLFCNPTYTVKNNVKTTVTYVSTKNKTNELKVIVNYKPLSFFEFVLIFIGIVSFIIICCYYDPTKNNYNNYFTTGYFVSKSFSKNNRYGNGGWGRVS